LSVFNSDRAHSDIDFERLAETGAISGPYKTRQLTSFACLLREPGPLPLWVRYRTRRELDAIERMEEPPRPVKRSILFGLFAGWD
jgi:hypothetical protein